MEITVNTLFVEQLTRTFEVLVESIFLHFIVFLSDAALITGGSDSGDEGSFDSMDTVELFVPFSGLSYSLS